MACAALPTGETDSQHKGHRSRFRLFQTFKSFKSTPDIRNGLKLLNGLNYLNRLRAAFHAPFAVNFLRESAFCEAYTIPAGFYKQSS